MKTLNRFLAVILMLVLLVLGMPNVKSYAQTANLSVTPVGATSFDVGEKDVVVSFLIKNKQDTKVVIDDATLTFDRSGITVKGGVSGNLTIEPGKEATVSFYVTVANSYNYSSAMGMLEFKNGINTVFGKGFTFDVFTNVESSTGEGGKYVVAVQISHTLDNPDGIIAGASNNLSIGLFNRGNTTIKNAEVKLVLPENMFINNGSSSSNMGSFSIGARKTANFSVSAETSIASKTYPITVEVTGFDYNSEAVTVKKTIYIPVISEGGSSSTKNLQITNVYAPAEAESESDFIVSFQVKNGGSSQLKNIKVTADVPEGLINKTRNTFVENVIGAGQTKDYSITYYAKDTAEKTYPIKITVESAETSSSTETTTNTNTVMQYTSVYIKSGNGTTTKTPQLLISDYSYGGTYAQAGTVFRLSLTLLNTSNKNLSNVKVAMESEEGTFIPVKSSNSFFIDKIAKKQTASKSVMLTIKPDAKQQTTALNITMTYEDGAGNEFTSKDTVSIPVMQESRLVIDEIVQPELYAGNPSGISVQFYNMGKTTLNNLRATAYGDFDTMESINYFVGNMEPGKNDTYDFTVMPRGEGIMTGAVVFTYEDASGEEQVFERPFEFTVMGQMPDMGLEEPQPEVKSGISKYLPFIIGGGVIVFIIAGIVIFKKIRKKKKHREMEIDD